MSQNFLFTGIKALFLVLFMLAQSAGPVAATSFPSNAGMPLGGDAAGMGGFGGGNTGMSTPGGGQSLGSDASGAGGMGGGSGGGGGGGGGSSGAGCQNCICVTIAHEMTRAHIEMEHQKTRMHISYEFESHRNDFMIGYFFEKHLLPALSDMTATLVAATTNQTAATGAFVDANVDIAARNRIEQAQAQTFRELKPSPEMCTMGTLAKSVGASNHNRALSNSALSRQALDRQLQTSETLAQEGRKSDRDDRFAQYLQTFCKPGSSAACTNDDPLMAHRDIDVFNNVQMPQTLNTNFNDGDLTTDEKSLFAMTNNLVGHDLFESVPPGFFREVGNHELLLDMRSVAAMRGVVAHSLNAVIAERTAGSFEKPEDPGYAHAVLIQRGVPPEEALRIMGENPSYAAQMNLLTKQAQDPNFMRTLFDTPENISRTSASLQSIELMQKMESYKSSLRQQATTALLLETELLRLQDQIQNRLNSLDDTGPTDGGAGGPI